MIGFAPDLRHVTYYARRMKSLRFGEPFQRLRSWIRHRLQGRRFRLDPDAFSLERVYSTRKSWLRKDCLTDFSVGMHRALLERLQAGWWQAEDFWSEFQRLYPNETQEIIRRAESILAGRFRLFHWKAAEMPGQIRWSTTLEPDTPSAEWPAVYCHSINVHHDPRGPDRDIKWCWELNRFQHLLCLGAGWRLTREERFAREARNHIETWMDQVRYPAGVQWSSNLEVGLRALSWARCHILCMNSPDWDANFTDRLGTCLYVHGRHLERELTVHHAVGNHLLGEASALFCLSVLYPVFVDSARWQTRSLRILNAIVPRLILQDGVYAEQSTGYCTFVLDFLLSVLHLARLCRLELQAEPLKRMVSALHFLKALSPHMVETPHIGDSDTGMATGWGISGYWDFSHLLASGAVLLHLPALAEGLEDYPAESFLLLGGQGLTAFESYRRLSPGSSGEDPSGSETLHFPDGGYLISRDRIFSVTFDGGPLGIAPGYGHGHADGLSFLLYHKGNPVVVDSGTCVYNGPPRWRDYFRSSSAHNTLQIDGKGPVEPLDTFRWDGPLEVAHDSPVEGNGWTLLRGRLRWGGFVHCRCVLHLFGGAVIILDQVEGTGEHHLDWRLHFHPRWSIGGCVDGRIQAGGPTGSLEILLLTASPLSPCVLRGSLDPMGGWYSEHYGDKIPTSTLAWSEHICLPACGLMAFKESGRGFLIPRDLPGKELPGECLTFLDSKEFHSFAKSP